PPQYMTRSWRSAVAIGQAFWAASSKRSPSCTAYSRRLRSSSRHRAITSFSHRWYRQPTLAHITVDSRGVRPVRLDGNDGDAVMRDQVPGNGRTRLIELRGTGACLPKERDAPVGSTYGSRTPRPAM